MTNSTSNTSNTSNTAVSDVAASAAAPDTTDVTRALQNDGAPIGDGLLSELAPAPASEDMSPAPATPATPNIPEEPGPETARFGKVYGKMKHLEREDAVNKETIGTLQQQMAAMQQNLNQNQSIQIDNQIASLQDAVWQASQNGDQVAFQQANNAILQLNNQKAQLGIAPQAPTQTPNQQMAPTPSIPNPQVAQNPVTPAIYTQQENIAIENYKYQNATWFGVDAAMTHAADGIMRDINNDPVWGDREMSVKLGEVQARMKKSFPILQTPQTVESPGEGLGGLPPGTPNVTELTEEQKYVAQRTFPNLPVKQAYDEYRKGM